MKTKKYKYRYIYFLGLFVLLIMFLIGYYKYSIKSEAIKSKEYVIGVVTKVVCNRYRESNNYIVFFYKNSKQLVNVGSANCESYKVGDSLKLYHNKKYDIFFTTNIDVTTELWSMIIFAFFFIVIFLYLFKPIRRRSAG